MTTNAVNNEDVTRDTEPTDSDDATDDIEQGASELECLELEDTEDATTEMPANGQGKSGKDTKKKGRFWAAFKLRNRFGPHSPDHLATRSSHSASDIRRDTLSSHRLQPLQSRSPLLTRIGHGLQRRALGARAGAVAARLRHTSMRALMLKVPPPPCPVELPEDLLTLFPRGEFPTYDIDELRIIQRAREMELGLQTSDVCGDISNTRTLPQYVHCLVPHLSTVTSFSCYWGVMDRYEAEALLDGRPEGSFVLRDSAQDDFLYSVTFRRYGLTLHARLEQWAHRFSFNTHDPGVYADASIAGLLAHYRQHDNCLFFEPLLTLPIRRTSVFSLQHLCRATICDRTTYDGVAQLPLPTSSKEYLQYYHYKQKIRVPKPTI